MSPIRSELPDISINENVRQVRGVINVPGKAFALGEMSYEEGWPLRIQYLDYESVSARLEVNVLPLLVMLANDELDGYARDWQPVIKGPEKNYSYMFQWFAMALAVFVLYVLNGLRQQEDGEL